MPSHRPKSRMSRLRHRYVSVEKGRYSLQVAEKRMMSLALQKESTWRIASQLTSQSRTSLSSSTSAFPLDSTSISTLTRPSIDFQSKRSMNRKRPNKTENFKLTESKIKWRLSKSMDEATAESFGLAGNWCNFTKRKEITFGGKKKFPNHPSVTMKFSFFLDIFFRFFICRLIVSSRCR